MKAICKRELRALLGSLRGWGYAAIVLLSAAVSMMLNNVVDGAARFEINAYYIALGMIPATALLTADSFNAERRHNTERLLYSLPLKSRDIVFGKLLALLIPVTTTFIVLCVFPLIMTLFCSLSLSTAYASILALFFLGTVMTAIGLTISVASRHWLTAFLGTAALLIASWAAPYAADYIASITAVTMPVMIAFMIIAFAATYLLSNHATLGIITAGLVEMPMLLSYLRGDGTKLMQTIAAAIRSLSLFDGLNSFINGLFDGSVLIMYLAAAVLFGFIALLCINNRRQAKRRAL